MEAIKSPMRLKDFAITETELSFIPFSDDMHKINAEDAMSQWGVDVDFDIQLSDESNIHNIQLRIKVNLDRKPGYCIDVVGIGLFMFEHPITPEELHKFLFFSGVSICISSIRAYIANITSYGILGKYTIPTIDMPALLQDKVKAMETVQA